MDRLSAMLANYLLNNETGAALLEMSFPAATLLFKENAIIALAGANFSAHINDKPIENYKPYLIHKKDVLHFKKQESGSWIYLAVQGGFKIDPWLGSYSTHAKVKLGGYKGRLLQKNDVLEHATTQNEPAQHLHFKIATHEWEQCYNGTTIRVLPGNEFQLLTESSKVEFYQTGFNISQQSDRMGYRLEGKQLSLQQHVELISTAVSRGTLQLLPNGQCIVLMADHQTTGGYPRIAQVISADIPKLAQLQFSKTIKFEPVDISTAEESLLSMQRWLQQIRISCSQKFKH
jgi:antagonist of KipI